MSNGRCARCKAWDPDSDYADEGYGFCRRRAPTASDDTVHGWRQTSARDWCCEFEHKPTRATYKPREDT